jgi:hypothetical protein
MSNTYSLVMTNATYIIDEAGAGVLANALEQNLRTAEIGIDLSGSGNVRSTARIVIAHVMAVVCQPALVDDELVADGNVYALPLRR